jgi:hypothetical protein
MSKNQTVRNLKLTIKVRYLENSKRKVYPITNSKTSYSRNKQFPSHKHESC